MGNPAHARRRGRSLRLLLALLGTLGTTSLAVGAGSGVAAAAASTWAASSVQAPGKDDDGFVNQVACTGPGTCAAVGDYKDDNGHGQGMVLNESSGTWGTAQRASLPSDAGSDPNALLNSVSCPSTGECEAVGSYEDASGDTQMLAVAETSGTWQTGLEVTAPAQAGTDPLSSLDAVSCASAGNCTAVGTFEDSSFDTQGLVATETSGTWAAVEAPLPASGAAADPDVVLFDVACASDGNCTAVGSYTDSSNNTQGLLLTETSGAWTASEAALPSGANSSPNVSLYGVACTSAGNCSAVGNYTDSSNDQQGVFLTQSGGTWGTGTEAGLPTGAATDPGVLLTSVSCPAANACTAVGDYDNSSSQYQALAFNQSSGNWGTGTAIAPPTGAATNPNAILASVSCTSAATCSAVGNYYDSGQVQQGLFASETSGTWTNGQKVTAPAGAGSDLVGYMGSVSCTSAGNCSAGGIYLDSNQVFQGLVVTQESGAWGSGQTVALPTGAGSVPSLDLFADSCPTATDCVAVGVVFNAEDTVGAVATESSGSWTFMQPSLPTGGVPPDMVLDSVSCPTAGNCSVVGSYVNSEDTGQGLLLNESSGTWQTGTTAALPAGAASDPKVSLSSVSCSSDGNCTAVGSYTDNASDSQGLLLTETAGTWASGVEAPLPANAGSDPAVALDSVSCTSPGYCTAVGSYTDSTSNTQGLLLSETAGTWARGVEASVPDGAAANPQVGLLAVSCSGAGDCTAVGGYSDSSGSTLPLVVTESSGTWNAGFEPGLPNGATTQAGSQFSELVSVSCTQPGDCAAVGSYVDSSGDLQAVVFSEFTGTWRTGAQAQLPSGAAPNPDALATSVSCTDAGDCAAVGYYTDSAGHQQAFEVTEVAGSWNPATEAAVPAGAASPSQAILNAVSCASDGNCTAVGVYTVGTAGDDGLVETLTTPLPAPTPLPYTPITPIRICDTRPGDPSNLSGADAQCNGANNGGETLSAGGILTITVPGLPTGATAAVLNVTVTDTTAPSYLTAWPTGATQPNASNLNWVAGETVPNLVEVTLGPSNQVSFYNAFGSADVVVDLQGYVAPTTAGTGLFNPLSPSRICDTRPPSSITASNQCDTNGNGTLGPAGILTIAATGVGGVPSSGVSAVVLNVTVTNTTAPSYLTVWPATSIQPTASNLNWVGGETVPNRVIVPVGTNGEVSIYNAFGSADVIVDVGGWFTDNSNPSATGDSYVAITPTRICDTRAASPPGIAANQCNEEGNAAGTLGQAGDATVQVTGLASVPITATAVVANVTVTDTTAPSYLTVWPDGVTQPTASDLNWVGGETVPNLVVAKLGSTGAVDAYNAFGSADVIVDVEGYYLG